MTTLLIISSVVLGLGIGFGGGAIKDALESWGISSWWIILWYVPMFMSLMILTGLAAEGFL